MKERHNRIAELRLKLAGEVRELCKAQVDIWREIPWLAIEADGRDSWTHISTLGFLGLWRIDADQHWYSLMVDCNSGELLRGLKPAEADDIIALSARHDLFDAAHVRERLIRQAKFPYKGPFGGQGRLAYERKWDGRKERRRKTLGIEKMYTRKMAIPSDWDTAFKMAAF